ncbi:hypothetical protein [Streptomyces sp. NRRL F-5123]|uniref:hypothetical protein n=1 Tax=Streptomyces sp. NRRL F-5123 TaxID=1463856 RepID=UPI00069501FD|nr:hypothetical protein [Streptomyces sp. NRRL F-5123]
MPPNGHDPQTASPAAAGDLVHSPTPLHGPMDTTAVSDPIVFVPHGTGYVGVPKTSLPDGYLHPYVMPAPQPRDLTPVPLIDPRAQMVAASGISAGAAGAGIGWGIGQAAAGISAMSGGSALAVILAGLLLTKLSGRNSGGTRVHNETHITNNNRWFGKSTTTGSTTHLR